MSNSYTQGTVQPELPKRLFSDLELKYLKACGFKAEETGGVIYLFFEQFFEEYLEEYPTEYFTEEEEETTKEWVVNSIFQRVIKDSNGEIPEITFEGAFTCDKMRPGEFGGFCRRITLDSIQDGGTYQLLEWFRKNPGKELLDVW